MARGSAQPIFRTLRHVSNRFCFLIFVSEERAGISLSPVKMPTKCRSGRCRTGARGATFVPDASLNSPERSALEQFEAASWQERFDPAASVDERPSLLIPCL